MVVSHGLTKLIERSSAKASAHLRLVESSDGWLVVKERRLLSKDLRLRLGLTNEGHRVGLEAYILNLTLHMLRVLPESSEAASWLPDSSSSKLVRALANDWSSADGTKASPNIV